MSYIGMGIFLLGTLGLCWAAFRLVMDLDEEGDDD